MMEKLDPIMIQRAIQGLTSDFQIEVLEETTSTNDYAHQIARKGASEGHIVIAEKQTAGKGRLDRTWESPAYKNLYLSIILRPDLSPEKTPQFNLVAGLAAFRCFKQLAPHGLQLKWPNDLLLKGKKVGGILTEMEITPDGKVDYMVVGVGLNINADLEDFSPGLQKTVGSLKIETQEIYPRSEIAGMFLNEFFTLYRHYLQSGFSAFQFEWENASQMKGKKVSVQDSGRSFEGQCMGIDANGYLIVDSKGVKETIVAGDVTWS